MTKQGGKIEDVSEGELKEYIEIDTDSKPYWRLVVAIEYKNGLSPHPLSL